MGDTDLHISRYSMNRPFVRDDDHEIVVDSPQNSQEIQDYFVPAIAAIPVVAAVAIPSLIETAELGVLLRDVRSTTIMTIPNLREFSGIVTTIEAQASQINAMAAQLIRQNGNMNPSLLINFLTRLREMVLTLRRVESVLEIHIYSGPLNTQQAASLITALRETIRRVSNGLFCVLYRQEPIWPTLAGISANAQTSSRLAVSTSPIFALNNGVAVANGRGVAAATGPGINSARNGTSSTTNSALSSLGLFSLYAQIYKTYFIHYTTQAYNAIAGGASQLYAPTGAAIALYGGGTVISVGSILVLTPFVATELALTDWNEYRFVRVLRMYNNAVSADPDALLLDSTIDGEMQDFWDIRHNDPEFFQDFIAPYENSDFGSTQEPEFAINGNILTIGGEQFILGTCVTNEGGFDCPVIPIGNQADIH